MTPPALTASAAPAHSLEVDVLVVGVRKTPDGPRLAVDAASPLAALDAGLVALGVTGAADETSRQLSPAGVAASSVLLVGLGVEPVNPDALRSAAGTASRVVSGASRLAVALPAEHAADVQALAEGAALGAYRYTAYRSNDTSTPIAEIAIVADIDEADAAVERAGISASAVAAVRDLVSTPPNDLYPASFAERARELAVDLPLEIEEWDVDALTEGGFGGILGVGQG